jgi:hypothetical protein
MNPISDPQAYDVVKIDGVENPGVIAQGGITGFTRPTEWDIKKGKGTKGGTATLSQLPPAKGSIKFLLWSPFHVDAWDLIYRKRFLYDPTKKTVNAVDIYHPALATVGIHSVVTESIGPPVPEGKGLWSITVELLEYLPSPKKTATSTPSGSSGGGGNGGDSTKGQPDDPIADAQQKEIAKLLAEAAAP